MKIYLHRIGIIVCIGFMFSSCSEEFLERPPLNRDNSTTFFSSETEAVGAVNSLYNAIARPMGYDVGHIALGDVAADDMGCFDANWFIELDNYQAKPTGILFNGKNDAGSGVQSNWAVFYNAIFRANWILENINSIEDINSAIRSRSIYEARFIRALAYFSLTNTYGDIPLFDQLISSNESFNIGRSTKDEVLDFVHSELLACAGLDENGDDLGDDSGLPLKGEYELGRATRGAALAFLARSYLYEADYGMAEKISKILIDQGNYDLEWDDYGANWDNLAPNGIESIFEINVEPLQQPDQWGMKPGSWILDFTVNKNYRPGIRGGWSIMVPSAGVEDLFEYNSDGSDKDLRRPMTIYKLGDRYEFAPEGLEDYIPVPPTNLLLSKYSKRNRRTQPASQTLVQSGDSDSNIPVIRYAEVLLIYAEASFENGAIPTAYEYLNMIRRRAGLDEFSDDTSGVLFKDRLIRERRLEFLGEGHRFFDLRRWGLLNTVLGPDGYRSETNGYFPIPQNDLDLNPSLAPQNAGY